eukprot:5780171-Amphidinium_carterae.1
MHYQPVSRNFEDVSGLGRSNHSVTYPPRHSAWQTSVTHVGMTTTASDFPSTNSSFSFTPEKKERDDPNTCPPKIPKQNLKK